MTNTTPNGAPAMTYDFTAEVRRLRAQLDQIDACHQPDDGDCAICWTTWPCDVHTTMHPQGDPPTNTYTDVQIRAAAQAFYESITADVDCACWEELHRRARLDNILAMRAALDTLTPAEDPNLSEQLDTTHPIRTQILDQAKAHITGDRANDYGDATASFRRIAQMWTAILGHPVTAPQVALCLAALKISRAAGNPAHVDSWVDLAGYAALGAELATEGILTASQPPPEGHRRRSETPGHRPGRSSHNHHRTPVRSQRGATAMTAKRESIPVTRAVWKYTVEVPPAPAWATPNPPLVVVVYKSIWALCDDGLYRNHFGSAQPAHTPREMEDAAAYGGETVRVLRDADGKRVGADQ